MLSYSFIYLFSTLSNQNAKKTALIYTAVFFIFLIKVIFSLYFNPQKRYLSIAFGLLHGPIYDDWIAVNKEFVIERIGHFFLIISSFFFFKRKIASTITTLFVSLGCFLFTLNTYSIKNNFKSLDNLLPEKKIRDNLIFHYHNKEDKKKLNNFIDFTVFNNNELMDIFEPKKIRISTYLYT